MAVFNCKMCGGQMELVGGNVCECLYCHTKQTVPGFEGDQAQNMVNRANHFRQQCDFDKALELYEKILAEHGEDVDVFWSLALSRYGIEYVDDPVTQAKTPTCHRMQYVSILEDSDYLKAIQGAAPEQKEVLVSEARKIAEIQKGILEITRNESPFDIFICYKETDEEGNRTPDSVKAMEIYDALSQHGYKVFFSRVTLSNKVGEAYEPYIFAALQSARIMVSVGTSEAYFQAPWVRNEWSRFLSLIEEGAKKQLIPVYQDMSPEYLPAEFGALQAMDMSQLGFCQELVRGIDKLMGRDAGNAKHFTGSEGAFLELGYLSLENEEFDKASEYMDNALNFNPRNADAYLGKMMAQARVTRPEMLVESGMEITEDENYRRIMRYGDEEMKALVLRAKEAYITARHDKKYKELISYIRNTRCKAILENYRRELENYKTYPDYEERLAECDQRILQASGNEAASRILAYEDFANSGQPEKIRIALDFYRKNPTLENAERMMKRCEKLLMESERLEGDAATMKEQGTLLFD